MKIIKSNFLPIFLTLILLQQIATKKVFKKITAFDLVQDPQTIFITRFDFGVGSGNITLKYRKLYQTNTLFQNIKIGLLIDENYTKFKQAKTCEQKQSLYSQIHKIRFYDSTHGTQFIRIQQTIRQHLWFIYAYNCDKLQINYTNKDQKQGMNFDLILLNNGSQLGQDQNLVWPFCIILILWLILLIYLIIPVIKSMHTKPSWAQTCLYIGYLILGLGIFYKFIGLLVTYLNGDAIFIFDALHIGCKTLVQGIMVAVLVSIAWGWSLTYRNYQTKYTIVAIVVTILNIIIFIIWHSQQEQQDSYHQYQGKRGIFVMVIRISIIILFVWGCLRIKGESVGKRKYFIQKYCKLGLIYLCAWPFAVIFSQLFLPKYLHNQIIMIIQEILHLLMNAYICYLFANPDSDYQKINIKDQDHNHTYLPDYVKSKK